MLNLEIARAYLKGSDTGFVSRTWAWVMERAGEGKQGATKERWLRGVAEKPFDTIRDLKPTETKAEHLLSVLKEGTVSTNIFLRRLHNFALDMSWLLAPVIPRRQWRPVKFQEKRAITLEEHQKIIAGERNEEWRGITSCCGIWVGRNRTSLHCGPKMWIGKIARSRIRG